MIEKKVLQKIIQDSSLRALEVSYKTRSGHIGGSLSLIQALSYFLYKISNNSKNWRIILSKGHASLGLYSLFETLEIEKNLTSKYCTIPSGFHGHTCSKASKFILASTGSLGHGLPVAAGFSYASRKLAKKYKMICVTGDGDLQEGSNLEILHSLLKLKDCELKIINDDNSSVESKFIQTKEFFNNLKNNYRNLDIIKNFNMSFFQDHQNLNAWLSLPGLKIANCQTTKGFGFEEMYNNPKWHAGIPNDLEYSKFISSFNFKFKDA